MCSGVGVTMVIIVGMAMLLRRGWRIALLQTVPLAAAYAIWVAVSPKGSAPVSYTTQSLVQVIKFVVIGAGDLFGRLGQLPGLGVVFAVVLLVGFFVAVDREDLVALRRQFAVPVALFAGAGVFLLVTAVVRSGQPATIFGTVNQGPERARQSRYVYLLVGDGPARARHRGRRDRTQVAGADDPGGRPAPGRRSRQPAPVADLHEPVGGGPGP